MMLMVVVAVSCHMYFRTEAPVVADHSDTNPMKTSRAGSSMACCSRSASTCCRCS